MPDEFAHEREALPMPKKVVAVLCCLAGMAVWRLTYAEFLVASVQVAMMVGVWRASSWGRTTIIWVAAWASIVFPYRLVRVAAEYSASPEHATLLRMVSTVIAGAAAAFVLWALTRSDTKQWYTSKNPDEIGGPKAPKAPSQVGLC